MLKVPWRVQYMWRKWWLSRAGTDATGRLASRLAALGFPPYHHRTELSLLVKQGFISPRAEVFHRDWQKGDHLFLDDRVLIYQFDDSGRVELGDRVRIYRDTILQTGQGGDIVIGSQSWIQPRCLFSAFIGPIRLGQGVQVAAGCSFFSYNHGIEADTLINEQPLVSRGGITVGDYSWIGAGTIILDGVVIGEGAVVGAGTVVKQDVPAGAVVVGTPGRVVKMRT